MDIENQDIIATTNESVTKLALAILNATEGNSLLDIGSGYGDFLRTANMICTDVRLFGVELNEDVYRASLSRLPKEVNVRFDEAFTAYNPDEKFDKIFCHSPWGLEWNGLMQEYKPLLMRMDWQSRLKQLTNWLFCDLICRQLTDDGIGVAFLPLGEVLNSAVRSARECFIKQGWVKAVIMLPAGILETSAIQTVMVVFSKGNDCIKMVDARNIGTVGRRIVTFTNENIAEIISLCENDSPNSRMVGIQEIEDNDYILSPARYTTDLPTIPNAVPLGDVVDVITRGAGLTSKERDEITSQEDTGIYFLTVSDIENGSISNNLSMIREVTPKISRYVLNDGDVVLSKNGAPFKSSSYRETGRTVLANGNIYVIRTDRSRVNPHYLAAYLNSEAGQKHLENIGAGSMFLSLAVSDLKKMPIPLPPIAVQNKFADEYIWKAEELERLKQLVSEKEQELKDMFMREIDREGESV